MTTPGRITGNFDALRMIAALSVFTGHMLALSQIASLPYLLVYGLCTFFTISGFLVTRSWFLNPNPKQYLMARALRIFPALTVVVLLTIFVLGTSFTTLPIEEYLTHPDTYAYLSNIALISNFALPGVFTNTEGIRSNINAALWTLPVEYFLYMFVIFIGLFLGLHKKAWVFIIVISMFFVWSVIISREFTLHVHFQYLSPIFVLSFIFGAFFYIIFGDKFPVRISYFLLAIFLCFLATYFDVVYYAIPAFSYLILSIGFTKILYISDMGKYGDFSYGLYLYHCPVLKILITMNMHQNIILYLTAATTSCLIMAFLSWHLIEKPALALKHRFR